jgi:hypothetical protein
MNRCDDEIGLTVMSCVPLLSGSEIAKHQSNDALTGVSHGPTDRPRVPLP